MGRVWPSLCWGIAGEGCISPSPPMAEDWSLRLGETLHLTCCWPPKSSVIETFEGDGGGESPCLFVPSVCVWRVRIYGSQFKSLSCLA